MHQGRRRAVTAFVGLLAVSACAQEVRLSDTVETYTYREGDRGEWYLNPSRTEVGGFEGDEDKLAVAVDRLLRHSPASDRERSFWSGACAPGDRVASVVVTDELVTLRLTGAPASGACELTEHEAEMQRQQVAWTVYTALDPLYAEGAPTPVHVVDAGGRSWPAVVAHEAHVAPQWRPTPHT